MKVGDAVLYFDERERPHPALITAIHGPPDDPGTCVNLAFVSTDERRTDNYGTQIERASSVIQAVRATAPGRYFSAASLEAVPGPGERELELAEDCVEAGVRAGERVIVPIE